MSDHGRVWFLPAGQGRPKTRLARKVIPNHAPFMGDPIDPTEWGDFVTQTIGGSIDKHIFGILADRLEEAGNPNYQNLRTPEDLAHHYNYHKGANPRGAVGNEQWQTPNARRQPLGNQRVLNEARQIWNIGTHGPAVTKRGNGGLADFLDLLPFLPPPPPRLGPRGGKSKIVYRRSDVRGCKAQRVKKSGFESLRFHHYPGQADPTEWHEMVDQLEQTPGPTMIGVMGDWLEERGHPAAPLFRSPAAMTGAYADFLAARGRQWFPGIEPGETDRFKSSAHWGPTAKARVESAHSHKSPYSGLGALKVMLRNLVKPASTQNLARKALALLRLGRLNLLGGSP